MSSFNKKSGQEGVSRLKKNFLNLAIYFIIIFGVFAAAGILTARPERYIWWETRPGLPSYGDSSKYDSLLAEAKAFWRDTNLTGYDLSKEIVGIDFIYYDVYPEQLYFPEDFINSLPVPVSTDVEHYLTSYKYGTYRTILKLPTGITYGMTMLSCDFSHHTFINGTEYPGAGVVGITKEESEPQSQRLTYFFTPETDETEIIFQFSNFVHHEGGRISSVRISEQQNITDRNNAELFSMCIFIGCLLTAGLLHIGMFLFFGRKPQFLSFALGCLCIMMRILLTGSKPVIILLPDLNWYVAFALEYLSQIGMVTALAFYIYRMFDGIFHKAVMWYICGVSGVYALIVLFTDTSFYSRLIIPYQIAAMAAGLYMVVMILLNIKKTRLEQAIVLAGVVIFLGCALYDMYNFGITGANLTSIGMTAFVFVNMIALAVQSQLMEEALQRAGAAGRELSATNDMLSRLNTMKGEFLANISHEMKTPLAIMSGFAQLSAQKLKRGFDQEDVQNDLSAITGEANRLALLVSQLLQMSGAQSEKARMELVDVEGIIHQVARLYEHILQKKGNRIALDIEQGLPAVKAIPDVLIQIFLNLLSNADKHTENGVITICARHTAGQALNTVIVSVSDTGEGITLEILPYVFDRSARAEVGPESTGLGLSICKEAVEAHGGIISAENIPGSGAMITFTLPVEESGQL